MIFFFSVKKMLKLRISFLVLASVICATYGAGWQPGGMICGCFNPVYIDKPKTITECTPKTKFLNQIFQNCNNVNYALLLNGSPLGCDLAKYRTRINEMKERTLQMVLAYFSCTVADCTPAITAAYDTFIDYAKFEFNPYTYCSFSNFDPDCARVLIENRPPIYDSAHNIYVTLLVCAKLKAEAHAGKVDSRPIPDDECDCFSPKYISTLRNFVEINFRRIFGQYNSNQNSMCDFAELMRYTENLRELAFSMIKILEKTSPHYSEFDEYFKEFMDLIATYVDAIRSFILMNDKVCYSTARKISQAPISIVDAVTGVLTKCLKYKNVGEDRCSVYLK